MKPHGSRNGKLLSKPKHHMKTAARTLLCFLMPLLTLSCTEKNDVTDFEAIDFEVTGATVKSFNDGLLLTLDVPSTGADIVFTPVGDHAKSGFLYSFYFQGMDDYRYFSKESYSGDLPKVLFEEDGILVIASGTDPYVTEVEIPVNTSGKAREFEMSFGGAYTVTNVTINQSK